MFPSRRFDFSLSYGVNAWKVCIRSHFSINSNFVTILPFVSGEIYVCMYVCGVISVNPPYETLNQRPQIKAYPKTVQEAGRLPPATFILTKQSFVNESMSLGTYQEDIIIHSPNRTYYAVQ